MRESVWRAVLVTGFVVAFSASMVAQTAVPGQARKMDADHNGYADVGVVVTGHYTSLYAYDQYEGYYWDLGDGRVQGTVSDPGDLDAATVTTCRYVINYRATFENNPYMDTGWIQNHIVCSGLEPGVFHYLIVHKTDPRYTGNPDWEIWGDWEYHVLVASGSGNLVRKMPQL